MDIGSILLILALALLVAAFVARPLLAGHSSVVSEREHRISALLAERDRLLDALLELDFDNQMGKVPEDIYPAQRASLMGRAAEVLKELDALEPQPAPAGDAVEAAIAAKRATSGDPLETMIAQRKAAMQKDRTSGAARKASQPAKTGAKFCHVCGKAVQPGDRFCPNCGAALG
ncbi:MAG: zinc ribbon domain-containing protein [Chloroflexi bacterium]|nr:zinc ribbon domain-containing protein [Chloroflexota bacterium]